MDAEKPVSSGIWLDVAQKLGIPTLGLIAVSYALWHVGTHFVQPMYERQTRLIDQLSESVVSITDAVEMNAVQDARQTTLLDELAEISADTLEETRRAADAAQSHSAKLDKIAESIKDSSGGG